MLIILLPLRSDIGFIHDFDNFFNLLGFQSSRALCENNLYISLKFHPLIQYKIIYFQG